MIVCPYCLTPANLVGGIIIYPHRPDLAYKKFHYCKPCNAYVGCHPNSQRPLGRLANAELRRLKILAHAAFDPLWRTGVMTRKAAYSWLAKSLEISGDECHIGEFDEVACMRVIDVVKKQMEAARPKPLW